MLLRPFVRNGRPGLIGTMARTTYVVGLSHRPRARDAPAPAGQPTTPADPVARLRELVDLRKQGFLTEEEFAAQKALVLGQPQVLPAEPGRAPGGTGDQ
jgi:hypothetical protein